MLHENHQNNKTKQSTTLQHDFLCINKVNQPPNLKDTFLGLSSADCIPTKQQICEKGKPPVSFWFYSHYTAHSGRG